MNRWAVAKAVTALQWPVYPTILLGVAPSPYYKGSKMDWNIPPTFEFEHLTDNTRYPMQWLTMLKCVLNDYWMDTGVPPDIEEIWDYDTINMFVHKIYYCWYQTMLELHPEELQ